MNKTMAKKTNSVSISLVKPKRSILSVVKEMIGRALPESSLFGPNTLRWTLYTTDNSVDYAKVNYWLTRAIYYASEVQDPVKGSWYGKDFVLGASFGKPIVNATAAFTVGKLPEVQSDEGSEDQVNEINWWMEQNRGKIFQLARNSFRDGDSYIRVWEDQTASLIAPHKVEKVVDPVTGELLGFDITTYVKNDQENKLTKYVEELRKKTPFRQVKVYTKDSKSFSIDAQYTEEGTADEERPLPVVHFPNEPEPDQMYGNSDYQSVYALMANYHDVLANAIKNNIYNSNAVPVFEGIENIKEFMEANGTKRDDGTYEFKWNPDNLVIGGKGFNAKILAGVSNAADAQTILEIIFWLICQNSETPEFVMGTAVQSSKASVSEQMPVMIKKAERKQTSLTDPFKELVNLLNYRLSQTKSKFKAEFDFELKWLPILDDDLKLNIEIVKVLAENGCITDSTKMLLLNMQKYVGDFDEELKQARAEQSFKQQSADQNALVDQASVEGDMLEEDLTPEEEELANTPAA